MNIDLKSAELHVSEIGKIRKNFFFSFPLKISENFLVYIEIKKTHSLVS